MIKWWFDIINIYVVLIPLFVATLGQALVWSNCIAGALQNFSKESGSVSAYFSCLQMLLSALLSGFLALPHEYNQIPLALTILMLGLFAFILFRLSVFRK